MNSLVKQLRFGDFTSYEILKAADLIESQDRRIKELEAERDHWKFLATDYHNKLAALRQRIKAAEKVEPVAKNCCHNFDDGGVCLICGADIKDAYATPQEMK